MRHALTLLLLTASIGLADHQVQLTWEGTIDSPTILRIHGDRVESNISGTYTEPTFRFHSPLPRVNQTVQMNVRQGRGNVRILEQPRAANDYTLVVRIDPRRARDFYSLDFSWAGSDTADNRADNRADNGRDRFEGRRNRIEGRGQAGSATWTGYVDNEVFISFRNRRAFSTAVRGRAVSGERATFDGALPRQEVNVRVENAEGRGQVEVMEQPTADNSFTAKVRVVDPPVGASMYRFTLSWDDSDRGGFRQQSGGDYRQQTGGGSVLSPYPTEEARVTPNGDFGFNGLRWSGRVDGHIRVVVQNNRVYSQRISGGPIANEQATFSGVSLNRASGNVSIRKLRGRDDVEIVERPSPSNGYRLVFEIHDDDGGADDYEVEIRW